MSRLKSHLALFFALLELSCTTATKEQRLLYQAEKLFECQDRDLSLSYFPPPNSNLLPYLEIRNKTEKEFVTVNLDSLTFSEDNNVLANLTYNLDPKITIRRGTEEKLTQTIDTFFMTENGSIQPDPNVVDKRNWSTKYNSYSSIHSLTTSSNTSTEYRRSGQILIPPSMILTLYFTDLPNRRYSAILEQLKRQYNHIKKWKPSTSELENNLDPKFVIREKKREFAKKVLGGLSLPEMQMELGFHIAYQRQNNSGTLLACSKYSIVHLMEGLTEKSDGVIKKTLNPFPDISFLNLTYDDEEIFQEVFNSKTKTEKQ